MNYTKQYLDGYLSDEPLSRYEKSPQPRRAKLAPKWDNDKERTVRRKKERLERLKVVENWAALKIQE
jgi:hypothetical protein